MWRMRLSARMCVLSRLLSVSSASFIVSYFYDNVDQSERNMVERQPKFRFIRDSEMDREQSREGQMNESVKPGNIPTA